MWFLEQLSSEIDNCVVIVFLVQLLQIGVATKFLYHDNIYFWFLLQRCFLYCQHFCHDQECMSRQSLVATYLISCCSFILILRHSLLPLGVVDVFYHDPIFMSRQNFSVFSLYLCRDPVCYVTTRPLFLVLESFSRHRNVCCDLVY